MRAASLPASILALLLVLGSHPASAQESAADLYARGVDLYQGGSYDQAVLAFESLREHHAESNKYDDALYYLGRAYGRLQRWDQAEAALRSVLALPSTNRRVEAAYELGRILYRRKDYAGVVTLLSPLRKDSGLDNEDDDLTLLLAKTHYSLGILAKNDGRSPVAEASLKEAVSAYRLVAQVEDRPRSRQEAMLGLAKSYTRLLDVAGSPAAAREYRQAALDWIQQALPGANEQDAAELDGLRARVKSRKISRAEGELQTTAGTDTLTLEPGPRVSAAGRFTLARTQRSSLELGAGFEHDGLTLKTFNFTAAEIDSGDGRLLQRTDNLNADLVWRAGRGSALRSRFRLHGDYTIAEDPEHSNLDLKLSEGLDYILAPRWKLQMDGSLAWTTYPSYLVNGRELDYVEVATGPQLTWYANDSLRLELGYAYSLKQYLNATYDTPTMGVDSTRNRRYHHHSAELGLKARLGEVFRPSLSYTFAWNDSVNYDVWVSDAAASDRFVRGYNDYLESSADLGLGLRWSPRLRTDLSASLAYRSYLSYPARDASDTFTGSLRRDLELDASLEALYLLASSGAGQFGDLGLLLRADYRQSISNMLYERYFDTNFTSFSIFGGLSLKL